MEQSSQPEEPRLEALGLEEFTLKRRARRNQALDLLHQSGVIEKAVAETLKGTESEFELGMRQIRLDSSKRLDSE